MLHKWLAHWKVGLKRNRGVVGGWVTYIERTLKQPGDVWERAIANFRVYARKVVSQMPAMLRVQVDTAQPNEQTNRPNISIDSQYYFPVRLLF